MILNQPFVSFLLPVFNGEKYLDTVMTSIIRQIDQDFELIVSIDASVDSSEAIAKKYQEKSDKIGIFTHPNRLGMRNNYDFLISKATGSWITILGQDDALMPFAVSELRRATEEVPNMMALVSRRAYGFWPETKGKFGRFQFIYPIGDGVISKLDSEKFLINCLKGFNEYLEGPQIYTGCFISRQLLNKISTKQNSETYPYPIPDVSSAASILLNTQHYHFLDMPLFIVGTSKSSTGILIEQAVDNPTHEHNVSQVYSDAFSGNEKKFIEPGFGIFTSFSWYLFEALSLVSKDTTKLFQKIDPSWIFAAVLQQTSKERKKQSKFKRTFSNQIRVYNVNFLSIKIKEFLLRFHNLFNTYFKLVLGLKLILTGKLILQKNSKNFSLLNSIIIVTRKISLQVELRDKNAKN